jgi:hypothetical protein
LKLALYKATFSGTKYLLSFGVWRDALFCSSQNAFCKFRSLIAKDGMLLGTSRKLHHLNERPPFFLVGKMTLFLAGFKRKH